MNPKDNVKDTRRFKGIEDIISYIPLFEGRPVRDTAIGHEDILNLQIALHTTSTVDDFIKAV